MMVVDHIEQLRELSNNPDFNVHCYSYAPVASVSQDLSEKYKDHIDSFVCQDDLVGRLSYGTASCAKELIMDSLIAVDGFGGTNKVMANAKLREECFEIIQTRRKEIYHGKEPRYPLLYVPGCVYQFRRGGSKTASKLPTQDIKLPGTNPGGGQEPEPKLRRRASTSSRAKTEKPPFTPSQSEPVLPTAEEVTFTLHRSSPMLSEEVLISKTCLEDHMVVTYLTAFQTVRQDCMRHSTFQKATEARHGTYPSSFSSSSSTLKPNPVRSSSSTLQPNPIRSSSSSTLKPNPIRSTSLIKLPVTAPFTQVDQETV